MGLFVVDTPTKRCLDFAMKADFPVVVTVVLAGTYDPIWIPDSKRRTVLEGRVLQVVNVERVAMGSQITTFRLVDRDGQHWDVHDGAVTSIALLHEGMLNQSRELKVSSPHPFPE